MREGKEKGGLRCMVVCKGMIEICYKFVKRRISYEKEKTKGNDGG